MCAQNHLQRVARDDLEGGNPVSGAIAQVGKQRDGRVGIRDRDEKGEPGFRQREQLQHRAGDDAERAFRADEHLLQVIAGGILAQARHAVPDPPVRQHDLEAERELARRAVFQHVHAAGIGREVAADLAAAFRRET